jgi:hypothetical protein
MASRHSKIKWPRYTCNPALIAYYFVLGRERIDSQSSFHLYIIFSSVEGRCPIYRPKDYMQFSICVKLV